MMTLFLLMFPLLLFLPVIGFFLPPPKQRPDGMLYWVTLAIFLCFLLCGLLFIGMVVRSGHWDVEHAGPVTACILIGLHLALILGLLANTFWVKGVARKLPEGMDTEEHWEAISRLSRRLWWPFLALDGLCLLILAVLFFGAAPTPPSARPVAPRPAAPPVVSPSP